MGRRKSQIAKGLLIGVTAEKMGESAKGEPEKLGKHRWEKQFLIGTRNWTYWMRIVYPYVMHIATHPNLTEEQKQVAVKEFFRRVREGLPTFLASLAGTSVAFGMAYTMPVARRSPKPPASLEGVIV